MTKLIAILLFPLSVMAATNAAPAKSDFNAAKYSDLRPRLLLKATSKVIDSVNRNPDYVSVKNRSYAPEFSFTKELGAYKEGQLFRVVYKSESNDDVVSGFTSEAKAEDTGFNNYALTLQPVDESLNPEGAQIEIATKAQPGQTVAEFLAKDDEASLVQSLNYGRAGAGDLLVNPLPVTTREGTIPANSKAMIVKVDKVHQAWSLAYNYTLTIQVSPCTPELQRTRCLAKLTGDTYRPDVLWAQRVAPQNIRHKKILGMDLYY